jgi:hypothetical protein
MQEKVRGLFVAATANRINLLPAEMIRNDLAKPEDEDARRVRIRKHRGVSWVLFIEMGEMIFVVARLDRFPAVLAISSKSPRPRCQPKDRSIQTAAEERGFPRVAGRDQPGCSFQVRPTSRLSVRAELADKSIFSSTRKIILKFEGLKYITAD